MKVSEEIDALRSIGFDPVRWLVVPRCLALVIVLPILTWIGDVFALGGALIATTTMTDMPVRMYLMQMGEIPLLNRAQEIDAAKQIERTRVNLRIFTPLRRCGANCQFAPCPPHSLI